MLVDFHTHCFPDRLASRAIPKLSATGGIKPYTDGTASGLQGSMKEAGIFLSVVLPVATSVADVEPRIRHEVGETSTLVTLVAGGLGAAVVPEPVTALALDGVVYRPLVRPAAAIELAVAHRADRNEPHLTRAVQVIRRLT